MISRRTFALAAVTMVALSGCATDGGRVVMPKDTRLIVVRHADRDGENLSERGKARAQALVTALEGTHIDAIYTLGIQRNIDTATPLAEDRGLPLNRIPRDNYARRILEGNEGKTVIWVGNKGNLAEIWESLGAADPAPLEYGDLFIVERGTLGGAKVTRLRFGEELDA